VTPISVTVRQVLSNNLPFVVVLGIVAAGILYSTVVPEHWLRGVVVTAIGVLIGGRAGSRYPIAGRACYEFGPGSSTRCVTSRSAAR